MDNEVIEHAGAFDLAIDADDGTGIDVYCWRLEQLLYAGYSQAAADALAADSQVDLHLACDLIARGCPEQTAYMIVS